MRGALLSAVLVAALSAGVALPHPQQPVALPPHLLRQYLAQNQQQRARQPEATPIYEQESQGNAQPQYVPREQALAQPQPPAQQPQYVQPQYVQPQYVQPQPEYRPKPQRPRPQPVRQQVQQDVENENPEDYEHNPSYQFGFDVNDDQFTNYQNRKEESEGGVIKGSYSVVDSDGFIRTVTYTADPKEGFKAEVVRKPTDIVVKVPTPAPPSQASHRHQQPEQYLDASSRVESRPQQQQYHRYQ